MQAWILKKAVEMALPYILEFIFSRLGEAVEESFDKKGKYAAKKIRDEKPLDEQEKLDIYDNFNRMSGHMI